MAYSLETSSVKTIVPGAEVSGFADVVARQKITTLSSEVPHLSAGEGIDISTVDGKTVITNNISAGENISFVYDQETNIIRLDAEGGGATYSGVAPIIVNNSTNQISISGEELSAGPNIDIFSSGGYVVISANGFPITGQVDTTTYSAEANFSSFSLLNTYGNVTIGNDSVAYNHAPAVSEEASWLDIIHAANEAPPERPNCYCYKFDDTHTAVNLSSLSAYDKVTIVNAIDNVPDCMLYWGGKTKEIPSGLYVDMIKGTYNNQTEWYFTASGWTNRVWWDYD